MTPENMSRHAQVLMAAALGLAAGLIIVLKSTTFAITLGILPILAFLAILVARQPAYLGIFLIVVFFTNAESLLSFIVGFRFGDVSFAIMAGYLLIALVAGPERPRFGAAIRAYFLFFVVCAIVIAISPYTRDIAFENWVKWNAYGQGAFLVVYLTTTNPKRFKTIAILIAWSGVVLSIFNILEFIDRSLVDFSSLPGRSAGPLINPNVSAAAILTSFILSYLYPSRLLILSRVVMFAGIYTTFSRFALIAFWPSLAYLELRTRKLTFRQIVVTASVLSAVIALTTYSALLVQDFSSAPVQRAYHRVVDLREGRFDDTSSRQRIRVIFVNLKRFTEHPIIGGGIGSASVIDSPHNEFLLLMAELGILPTVFYVLFLITVYVRLRGIAPREERQVLLTLYFFSVSYLLFTHNALTTKSQLIGSALLCVAPEIFPSRRAVPDRSRLAQESLRPQAGMWQNLLPVPSTDAPATRRSERGTH